MAAIDKLKSLAGRKAADRSSVAAQIAASPVEDDLPIPSNINTVFLGGLFLLAMLAACYVAAEIILPIGLAFSAAATGRGRETRLPVSQTPRSGVSLG